MCYVPNSTLSPPRPKGSEWGNDSTFYAPAHFLTSHGLVAEWFVDRMIILVSQLNYFYPVSTLDLILVSLSWNTALPRPARKANVPAFCLHTYSFLLALYNLRFFVLKLFHKGLNCKGNNPWSPFPDLYYRSPASLVKQTSTFSHGHEKKNPLLLWCNA